MSILRGFCVTLVVLMFCTTVSYPEERAFTVRDSIEMNTLSDPYTLDKSGTAKFAPDGKHFLVITTRGILESDQLESCLMVFDASGVDFSKHEGTQLANPPKCIAKLTATPHAPQEEVYASIISQAHWSDDSKSIYFLGQGEQAERYLYRVDITHGRLRQLSPSGYDVIRYVCAMNNVVYVASRTGSRNPNLGDGFGQTINRDARDVTGMPLWSTLLPRSSPYAQLDIQAWVKKGGARATMIAAIPKPLNGNTNPYFDTLSISPDGSKAVVSVPIRIIPRDWDNYEPAPGFEAMKIHAESIDPSAISSSRSPLEQYVLVDLHNNRMTPLIDAPIGTTLGYSGNLKAVWSENGRRLLLTNVFMPIGTAVSEQLAHPLRPCDVVSVDLAQGTPPRCVMPIRIEGTGKQGALYLVDVRFGSDSEEAIAKFISSNQKELTERYRDTARGWVGPNGGPPLQVLSKHNQKIEVYIRQGLNNPPTLWAKFISTGQEVQVFDPNPRLRNISYGEASLYHWKDSSGFRWSGILVKPVDYVNGNRYPLVIQTHGYSDWVFVTDGCYPAGMAARPLASSGIAVLQTEYRHDIQDTPEEAGIEADKFESAVRQLDGDGLIDPKRVGVVGFSYSAWQVEATLGRVHTMS